MNKLVELYESTVALHERFETSQTVQQSLQMFSEEYNETLNEIPGGHLDLIAQEFVDSIVTVIGVFRSISNSDNDKENYQAFFVVLKGMAELYFAIRKAGVTNDYVNNAVNQVIHKNNTKSLETHYLDKTTGKIRRKS